MPGQVIGKSLNLGYPGTLSHSSDNIVVNRTSAGDIPFGAAVVLNPENTVAAFGAADTADNFLGIAVRIVKQQTSVFEVMGSYHEYDAADICVRGSVIVTFNGAGIPTAGGPVYIRRLLNPAYPGSAVGDIEAAADGANNILIP